MSPTQTYNLGGKETVSASQFQIPAPYLSAPAASQRRKWPWVVAILALIFIVVVAVVLIAIAIPRKTRTSGVEGQPQPTPVSPTQTSTPSPAASSASKDNSSEDEDDVPTDKAEVLSSLTKLESDWQQANVNGDKDALEQILADEYIGGANSHNKRQYLNEITHDSSVRSWELQNLSVSQDGKRATMHGNLTQETSRGAEIYEFTDTFVWRDSRWQAVSSHATRVK